MQSGAVQQGVGLRCYWFVSFRERLMSAARLRSCCSVPCDLVSSLRRWFPQLNGSFVFGRLADADVYVLMTSSQY